MTIILVATVKGGSGKTTVSVNLAAALAGSGVPVSLADVDRQRSSLEWLSRRPSSAPSIYGLDWTREIGRIPSSAGVLVVDTPAALRGKQVEELVGLADRILVPIVPSVFDESATRRFLGKLDDIRAVSKGGKPVGIVGNRMRAGTRSAERLSAFLATTRHRAVAELRDAQAYLDVAESGLGVFDRGSLRFRALRDDWEPLLAFARGERPRAATGGS